MTALTPSRALRPILVCFALAALFATPVSAHATRTLGLSSGTFKFEVPKSGELVGQVVVSNEGDEPIKVLVYSSDQKVDGKGNLTYVAPTRADLSSLGNPSTWVRVSMPSNSKSIGNIPYLELRPGEKVPVKFSLSVPPDTTPGDHNVLIFFESFDLPKAGQSVQSVVSGRLGTRITLRVPGELFKKLEVRPFNVPAFIIGGTVPYNFTVRNLGNTDVRLGVRVLLLDRGGNEVVSQTPIDGRTSFANSNIEVTGTVLAQGVAIGRYKVRLDASEVDGAGKAVSGGKETITQERTVWLVPAWLLIAVGAVVVLGVFRLVWMAAARSTGRQRDRDDADRRRSAELDTGLGEAAE